MRATILVLAMLVLVGCVPEQAPSDWAPIYAALKAATAKVDTVAQDGQVGVCSSFAIGSKGYFMTAWHCLAPTMTVDGYVAWSVFEDETNDLAVLMAPGAVRKGLLPAAEDVKVGKPIATLGYGNGWEIPQLRTGYVVAVNMTYPTLDFIPAGTRATLFDILVVHGQSGGAVVDRDGRFVSVMQMSNPYEKFGLGRPLSIVLARTKAFF